MSSSLSAIPLNDRSKNPSTPFIDNRWPYAGSAYQLCLVELFFSTAIFGLNVSSRDWSLSCSERFVLSFYSRFALHDLALNSKLFDKLVVLRSTDRYS